jgi:hypothetical protein
VLPKHGSTSALKVQNPSFHHLLNLPRRPISSKNPAFIFCFQDLKEKEMSFFAQIGQGLAYVHQEAVKHVTPENINWATQEVWKNVDNAAQQINQVFILPPDLLNILSN